MSLAYDVSIFFALALFLAYAVDGRTLPTLLCALVLFGLLYGALLQKGGRR